MWKGTWSTNIFFGPKLEKHVEVAWLLFERHASKVSQHAIKYHDENIIANKLSGSCYWIFAKGSV
jgi:hypothetical protein